MMIERKQDRHGWIKNRLAERGHMQKDVARAWKVDDAVVSRFLKTGDPQPTLDRIQALAPMLGMELGELAVRLQEDLAPPMRRRVAAHEPAEQPVQHHNGSDRTVVLTADSEPVKAALDALRESVARVQALLLTAKVSVNIVYNGTNGV